jgi:hypothetical protein
MTKVKSRSLFLFPLDKNPAHPQMLRVAHEKGGQRLWRERKARLCLVEIRNNDNNNKYKCTLQMIPTHLFVRSLSLLFRIRATDQV